MFGEFVEDASKCEFLPATEAGPGDVPLWRRIGLHLALRDDVVLKSQQRGEPELSTEEKVVIAKELMTSSPSQFLYRFGRYLLSEHLAHFEPEAQRDPVTAHYLADAREKLDLKKHKIRVRNRRWAALQRLKDSSTTPEEGQPRTDTDASHEGYFSEAEMKKRNPLLYQQLVGQHLTAEEINERKQNFDRSDCRFTTIIYDHLDQCYEKEFRKKQEEQEDDMFEEEEEEEDDEETDNEEEEEAMEEECETAKLAPEHKTLLKEEFVTSMYTSFVSGKDDAFNYKSVDENEEFDLLEVEGLDKEEKYFDEEEPCDASPMCSAPESPILPRLCLDRRIREDRNFNRSTLASVNVEPNSSELSVQRSEDSSCTGNNSMETVPDHNLPRVETLSLK